MESFFGPLVAVSMGFSALAIAYLSMCAAVQRLLRDGNQTAAPEELRQLMSIVPLILAPPLIFTLLGSFRGLSCSLGFQELCTKHPTALLGEINCGFVVLDWLRVAAMLASIVIWCIEVRIMITGAEEFRKTLRAWTDQNQI